MRSWINLIEDAVTQSSDTVDEIIVRLKTLSRKPEVLAWIEHQAKPTIARNAEYLNDDGFSRYRDDIVERYSKMVAYLDQVDTHGLNHVTPNEVADAMAREATQAMKSHRMQPLNVASPRFKAWFGQSKVVDGAGKPLVVFRGTAKVAKATGFGTRRTVPSFTTSPDVASIYSASSDALWGETDYRPGANVTPVFLSIQNPLDLSHHEQINLLEFAEKIGGRAEDGQTLAWLIGIMHELEAREDKGFAFAKELPTSVVGEMEWDDLIERIEALGQRKRFDRIADLLMDTRVDTYALCDCSTTKDWAEAAGFDGYIHRDTFEVGTQFAPKLIGKQPQDMHGVSSDDTHLTYRPFRANQVKSVFNTGSFDPSKDHMSEQYNND